MDGMDITRRSVFLLHRANAGWYDGVGNEITDVDAQGFPTD
jgi:hypothetical protein